MGTPFLWQDSLEILFLASVIYLLSAWLRADKEKNLLIWLYGYCLLFIISSIAHIELVQTILFAGWPAALMIFVLAHERTLQKNIVTLNNITPSKQSNHSNWIELIISQALKAAHQKKSMAVVIEQNDSLYQILDAPCYLYAPIHEYFLQTLLASKEYNEEKLLWMTLPGKLVSYNCNWKHHEQQAWVNQEHVQNQYWKQEAALYTAMTDALVIKSHPENATFSVISQGKIVDHITASSAYSIIQASIAKSSNISLPKKGKPHGYTNKKHTAYQPHT